MRRFFLSMLLVSLVIPAALAQGLPGTRAALTCVDIVPVPGLSSAQMLMSWGYLDRVAIILENTESFPIELTGVECYFGNTQYAMMANIRFYQIVDESALPNLYEAGAWTGDWFAYGSDPMPGSPMLGYAPLDLTSYPDQYTPLIFNPGDKYAVEIENLSYPDSSPSMKIAFEDTAECPPFFFTPGTNLIMDCDNGEPPFIWDFKENVGGQSDPNTNFFIQVKYVQSDDYRVPATSGVGVMALLLGISALIVRRFRR